MRELRALTTEHPPGQGPTDSQRVAREARRDSQPQLQDQALLRIAGRVARLGGWEFSVVDQKLTWSGETAALHDEAPGFSPPIEEALAYYAPEYRQMFSDVLVACVSEGAHFDVEAQIVTARGRRMWARVIGEAVRDDDGAVRLVQGAFQDISEQKAAEEQIRRLADRLHETLETITDAFFTLDREWRFTYLNAAAERLLERTRAELLDKVFWAEITELGGTTFDREYHLALAEGFPVYFEEYYAPLDRWFEVEAHPSHTGLAVYFRDATERRKGREALRKSEERFRLLARATNDAIWDWDLHSDAVWWNDGFTTLFGFGPDEVEPTIESWTTRLHPDDEPAVMSSLRAAVEGDAQRWAGEYRFRCKDGSYAFVLDRGHILRDDAGRATRMIRGMTDLTERKRAEERLREQATLLDKAQDAIMVRDLDHHILYWNRSAERLYGWTAAEAVGRCAKDLLHPDPAAFAAAAEATVSAGEWVGELEQVTRDRHALAVEGRWTLVRDDRGEPKSILAINTDITARKKLEAQFLRAQRLESIGALAGGIAHDLNNVLLPILLTVSLLRDEETDAARREDLVTIETNAERGADMVRQLLSFARGADGRRSRVDLGEIAVEIQKMVRDSFPKDISFTLGVETETWEVNADPTMVHQLLTNLCVNARDAMPRGGALTLEIERAVLDEVYAGMHPEARPGPYVVMRVEDTGMGISPEIVDRIFEPFFTTKELGKGTGLGLSTVHAIVRNHGGFINVDSEVGKGTRFQVYLPAAVDDHASEEAAVIEASLPRGAGELVLVVDDEESIRSVARRTLERFGYRVLLAANGAEAVAQYAMHRDEVAVVLTDMAMPVMDGPATIVALKTMNPKVRIVGSSGLNANGNVAKAMGAGVQHFVPKPYTGDTILRVLRKVLSEPG
jgi:PAS domain S-box-containing protein